MWTQRISRRRRKSMKLTYEGIKDTGSWKAANIELPSYDPKQIAEKSKEHPAWVHFGIGNIFRHFVGGICDELLEKGLTDCGINCIETFDYEVVDKIYEPFDNLALSVTLFADGRQDRRVTGALSEAVRADGSDESVSRIKEIARESGLQMMSFTITEKGYLLFGDEAEKGPWNSAGAMSLVTSMLYERFLSGGNPIALVSMDNVSKNGEKLRASVTEVARLWLKEGMVEEGFLTYVTDGEKVSFPQTMIDKITPRPSETIANELEEAGVEQMQPVITSRRTYIAPFVNAEHAQYLVIEDDFPNGRPPLEEGRGVYMTDAHTVDLSEKMKVTACLNPVHSATGPLGVVLGYDMFADMLLEDELVMKMARMVAYDEGMPMLEDPGIISPKAFADELFAERFVNRYLGDTNLRLCTDTSMGVGVRFGHTIKAYADKYGSAEQLTAVPLGIAAWLRYLMAVDDNGNSYTLAPDPMAEKINSLLSDIKIGGEGSYKGQLKSVLSDTEMFAADLYGAGIADKIEKIFCEMISDVGAVRKCLEKYIG